MTVIIDYNFEDGTLNEFGSTVTDSGDLSAQAAAALAGTSYGMQAVVDDATNIYGLTIGINNTSGKMRLRFYFDPNSLTMGSAELFTLYYARSAVPNTFMQVQLRWSGSVYQIIATITNDAASSTPTTAINITDAPHYVEVYLQRASSDVASDGRIDVWVDGAGQQSVTGVDNYDRFNNFNQFLFGATVGLDAGTSGTFFLDELVINDDGSLIGAYSATKTVTVAEGTQAQAGDAATVTASGPTYTVIPAEGTQSQTGDAATVSFSAAASNVTPADGAQTQTGDASVVRARYSIATAEGTQSQTGDAPVVRARYTISPAEGTQAQTGDAATATYSDVVLIDDIVLEWITQLVTAEGTQSQTGDAATVTHTYPTYHITTAEGTQAQTGDAATVSVPSVGTYSVTPADGAQSQSGDAAIVIANGPTYTITVAEGTQAQAGDAATITANGPTYTITPSEGAQAQAGDAASVKPVYLLTTGEGTQSQTGDAVTVVIAALLLHGNRKLYQPGARVTHYAPARAILEVDDD